MSHFFASRFFYFSRRALAGAALSLLLLGASTRTLEAQDATRVEMTTMRQLRGEVVVAAQPLDANRTIVSARFILDGSTLAEVGAPGRYLWDTSRVRTGRHILQVQAFCEDGYVGLSDPTAVIVLAGAGSGDASTRELVALPFATYGRDERRIEVTPPRMPQAAYAGTTPSAPSGLNVEVYLNGVRQNFVPAAHLATISTTPKSASRSRSRHRASTRVAAAPAKLRKTVWMPARPLLERLGARVRLEKSGALMRAELDVAGVRHRIVMRAEGKNVATFATVRGHSARLDIPVRRSASGFFVPLDFCRQALNLNVRWPSGARRVDLFTSISPS